MLDFARCVGALILREMATSYIRSPGGFLWAFAEPIAGIALLSFVLSMAFQAPPLGDSFALFYAAGLVPFLFYSDLSSKVAQSINYSRALLAYPRVSLIDAILARFILNFLVQLAVASVILAGIVALAGADPRVDLAKVLVAFGMLGMFSMGVGTLNCFLLTKFPVWQRVWGIANRPLFVISCIFFTFESIPERFQSVLWWNPVVHLVGLMRRAIYAPYRAEYVSLEYLAGISLVLTIFGLIFLRRFGRDLVEG